MSCRALDIPAVVYRYQNVYGPGQSLQNPYTGILSIFSASMLKDQSINIFEDGKESRDFVYIDDVVNATIIGIEKKEADYQIFNVGSGNNITVKEVADILKRLYSSRSTLSITGNFRQGDIRHNYADISKISNTLGFLPRYSFEMGIKNFSDWVMAQTIEQDNSYQLSLLEMKRKGLFK
jgi:dTDP-L-rhamnose 4-epimerase